MGGNKLYRAKTKGALVKKTTHAEKKTVCKNII